MTGLVMADMELFSAASATWCDAASARFRGERDRVDRRRKRFVAPKTLEVRLNERGKSLAGRKILNEH
jgi:hypothetical protein